jgi:hypothetical protein
MVTDVTIKSAISGCESHHLTRYANAVTALLAAKALMSRAAADEEDQKAEGAMAQTRTACRCRISRPDRRGESQASIIQGPQRRPLKVRLR